MRILIADDSALIRDGLAHVLPAHGFEVAGSVADLPGLLAAVPATEPDVALIDIRMPPTFTDEGITGARTIRSRFPHVGVIVLSQARGRGLRADPAQGRPHPHRLPAQGPHHRHTHPGLSDRTRRTRRDRRRSRTRQPAPRSPSNEEPAR